MSQYSRFKRVTSLFLVLLMGLMVFNTTFVQAAPPIKDSTSTGNKGGGSKGGKGSSATATLDIQISLQPMSQEVNYNDSLTLNVSATGSGTLQYQWRKNGAAITNATFSAYTIPQAALTDAGNYDVMITNSTGSVTSTTATISVVKNTSVQLAWNPPTTRVDGSELLNTDIAEYRIYHATADGAGESYYVVSSGANLFQVDNLTTGTHYFVITAVDSSGRESNQSNMVAKVIF